CVVDAESVIAHSAGEKHEVFLLAGQTFEDLQKLACRGIQRVVELCFELLGALLPTKGFFAQIGDAAVYVQIGALKVVELCGEREHFGAKGGADFERQSARVFIQLANLEGSGVGILVDSDFNKFRGAGGK